MSSPDSIFAHLQEMEEHLAAVNILNRTILNELEDHTGYYSQFFSVDPAQLAFAQETIRKAAETLQTTTEGVMDMYRNTLGWRKRE